MYTGFNLSSAGGVYTFEDAGCIRIFRTSCDFALGFDIIACFFVFGVWREGDINGLNTINMNEYSMLDFLGTTPS